jgi:hypothetical protein
MPDKTRAHLTNIVATPLGSVCASERHLLDGAQRRGSSVCRL